jgi:mediator of RNA polymerase II transcription subunit 12, fungi type
VLIAYVHLNDGLQAEYYSSQSTIRDRIVNHKALSELDDLMNQVLARRAESHSNIP